MTGGVAAGHAVSAGIAADVLGAGGNAFDAAIAAVWGACVAEPVLASPAGGGFLIARAKGRDPEIFDFFAETPRQRSADGQGDFRAVHADFGTTRQEFHIGAGSTAIPGIVPGLFAVHGALATMAMGDLIEPAVRAARDGITVTALQSAIAHIVRPILTAEPQGAALFAPGGTLKAPGSVFQNLAFANALDAIAREGEAAMRDGPLAKQMIARIAERGGHLTLADLAAYQVERRRPVVRQIGAARIWSNPPPAAGGTLALLILSLLGERAGALALAQAIDRADAIRRAPDSPCDDADAALVADLRRIASAHAVRGTTHVSVIDAHGNAAAVTVSNGEGNGQMVQGFMLNNMLGEADLLPHGFGLWTPGQRLASMMAPSLIEADGAIVALGSGGSNRIRSAVAAVIANLARGMALEEAIARPRVHVEAGHLDFEDRFAPDERADLVRHFRDHRAWSEQSVFFGGVHAVRCHADGRFEAAGDPRREGVGLIVP